MADSKAHVQQVKSNEGEKRLKEQATNFVEIGNQTLNAVQGFLQGFLQNLSFITLKVHLEMKIHLFVHNVEPCADSPGQK